MNTWIKKNPLVAFFVVAFAITWFASLVYYFALPSHGGQLPLALTTPAALLWYYGPCLAALMITWITDGRAGLRRLRIRLLDWRVSWQVYAFIILYPLGLHLAVIGIDRLLGGPAPVFFQAEGVPQGPIWLVLLGLMVFQVLVRGIGEETGWRGYALPALQQRFGDLRASLVLGLLWALWHFHPANFDALGNGIGISTFITVFLSTFIFTWVANQARGSIFIAAIFHMTSNVAEFIIPLGYLQSDPRRDLLQSFVTILVILVLYARAARRPLQQLAG